MSPNDHWTLDIQALGMQRTGDELSRLVMQCRPPFAICVQGKWGSGKTSLMRYVMASLGGLPLGTQLRTSTAPNTELPYSLLKNWEKTSARAEVAAYDAIKELLPVELQSELEVGNAHVSTVWFNPWQHQGADNPLAALLHEIRAQLTFAANAVNKVKKIAQVSIEAGLTIIGDLIDATSKLQGGPALGIGAVPGKVRALGEAYEKRNFENQSDAQRFNLMFEQAVARLLGEDVNGGGSTPPKWLDRAGREVPLRRLVVFVDDLDRCSESQTIQLLESIKLHLQTRYCVFVLGMDTTAVRRAVLKSLQGANVEGAQEYLEKLFQATTHVPVCRNTESFVREVLNDAGVPEEAASMLTQLLEPNPRKIKNFINSLGVAWRIGRKLIPIEALALVHYLKMYHPEVCRILAYDPRHLAALHAVICMDSVQFSANADAVRLLFRRSFRHVFVNAYPEGENPKRPDLDAIVDELVHRLDRHKGDRAFISIWKGRYSESTAVDIEEELGPALVTDANHGEVAG